MDKKGALTDGQIRQLLADGIVVSGATEKVNPASLDISASGERYRIDSVFLPKHGEKVVDAISKLGARRLQPSDPLEKGVIYIIKIKESLSLDEVLYGYCNPKSSTGRHDLHVRIIADSTARYDTIPRGYQGDIWAIVVPRSYPVIIPEDLPISQIRFFNEDSRFNETHLEKEWLDTPLAYHLDGRPYTLESFRMKDGDGTILLTLDLSFPIVGYEARGVNTILDLGSPNASIESSTFFTPLEQSGDSILLKKDSFYILSTKEALRLPPHIASEMVDMDSRTGEFRSHYAGFFDPGWGYGKNGEGKGRPITLEVRPFEDVVISHGQPIGKVRFEYMTKEPERHYDVAVSNYLKQSGPKLAKQFKQMV